MDVLSDVLMSVRLTGAVFFDVDARSPFVTESPSVASLHHEVLSGAEHVIAFHVVTEGTCWAEIIDGGEPPGRAGGGRHGGLPGGRRQRDGLGTWHARQPRPLALPAPSRRTLPFSLRMSRESTADRTRFVCGFLGCDTRPFNPLLDSLPRIVHSPVSAQSRQWVAGLIDAAVQPSGGEAGAGREAMLAKLAELMFVEALRGHLAQLGEHERGWLAGVRHPQVGAALRLMHGRAADPWTLERLAREVGMSRSSFAEQFTSYVRHPADAVPRTVAAPTRCATAGVRHASASPRLPRPWATTPRPPSTGRSSERSAKPPALGNESNAALPTRRPRGEAIQTPQPERPVRRESGSPNRVGRRSRCVTQGRPRSHPGWFHAIPAISARDRHPPSGRDPARIRQVDSAPKRRTERGRHPGYGDGAQGLATAPTWLAP